MMVNGKPVAWTKGQDIDSVLSQLQGISSISSATIDTNGKITATTKDGSALNITDTTGGSAALLGLAPGNTAATLSTDSSISINKVEVRFKAGESMDSIVSAINNASTGVSASKDATTGFLTLVSNKDIDIASGTQGSVVDLGLVAGPVKAADQSATVSSLSISTDADAQKAIQALDSAIEQIDSQRSALGAVQNRFDSTVSNLQSISENSTAARSRIQDADFAAETAELTKQQTLQQASTAILSQANQLPSSVLKLLQ
jgi:flagellin